MDKIQNSTDALISRERAYNVDVRPTPQEELLIKLGRHAFSSAISQIIEDLQQGRSPSVLSIARPDVLVGFAEALRTTVIDGVSHNTPDTYKTRYFNDFAEVAAEGNAAAIEALPKFVTRLGHLALIADLILDNRKGLEEWHTHRPFIQYLGTFDPQHIGHRIAVQSALISAGESSSALLQVMEQHPRKKSFDASYEDRYAAAEEGFYKSSLLDNTRITQIDVPGGVGLAEKYPIQMDLLATLSGDDEYRWLTGSDKLLLDVSAIQQGNPTTKATARFSDPKMHAYVVHRQSNDRAVLDNGIDYVTDQFGTKITLVEELPYDCAPASSSRIKQLRAEGKDDEANHMQLYELEQ
ncbi:MAG TPA: hypothetical protein VLG40_04080 [Candidatus Saccharimonas sp.]|nr:hypothetical protein [Candidatus Saccharimonas sp.]